MDLIFFILICWILCKNSTLEDRVTELETRQDPEKYNE